MSLMNSDVPSVPHPNDSRTKTEIVGDAADPIAIVLRGGSRPAATEFYTPHSATLQVGKIVYRAGSEVPRHFHTPATRTITRTAEILIFDQGRALVDLYDDAQNLICTKWMFESDMIMLYSGGHGIRAQQDLIMTEIKQGPYFGQDEKVRF